LVLTHGLRPSRWRDEAGRGAVGPGDAAVVHVGDGRARSTQRGGRRSMQLGCWSSPSLGDRTKARRQGEVEADAGLGEEPGKADEAHGGGDGWRRREADTAAAASKPCPWRQRGSREIRDREEKRDGRWGRKGAGHGGEPISGEVVAAGGRRLGRGSRAQGAWSQEAGHELGRRSSGSWRGG